MSESNLHKHFRDDGDVPIPIPPANDSWKLMEQRLNEVMPVTHQAGGHTTPNSSGIIAKMLPVAKYAVVALFISGVVLYGVHRINRPAPVSTPEVEVSTIVTKDSTALATDSMADHINMVTSPDTPLAANSTISADSTAAGTNTPVAAAPGTSATNTPAGTIAEKTTHTPVAAKAPAVNESADANATNPAAGNMLHHSGAAMTPANTNVAANNRSGHPIAPGRTAEPDAPPKLKSGKQQRSNVNNTLSPATNPEDNHVAVLGLADINHPEASAMLKPELAARLTLQQLPLHVDKVSADHPLKVSRETMDRLTGYRMPRIKPHTPGYWQLMAQWRVPVPMSSSPAYYKGPDGNTQLYRLVIPGIRMQRTWRNAALSLDLNVMTTQLYRNQPYYDAISPVGANDLITRTLFQTFGYSASLAYHHRITGNFFGSAGVQGYYGHTASIHETVQSHDSTGTHTKMTTYGENSKIWNNISNFQGQITGEIYYDHARWQAAARAVVPVLHTARDSMGMNMKPVAQLELLLRWKINRRK